MYTRQVKRGVFVMEGINSLVSTYYFYYIYFFMAKHHGFDTVKNLLLAAGLGVVYTFSSMIGGRFAQKHGYFTALKTGFALLAISLTAGIFVTDLRWHLLLLPVSTFGICFTWPTLEALVSENEPRRRLSRMVGIYNLVWAASGAFAYFTGGALLGTFGGRGIFVVPACLEIVLIVMACWLERVARRGPEIAPDGTVFIPKPELPEPIVSAVPPATFLKMAWLANPFAYLAINTVVAVGPSIAQKLHLSSALAGVFCSLWFFVRAGAFVFLWLWPGWHYRFRWLANAFVTMLVCVLIMLISPNLPLLLLAQVGFGFAVGLIYYSSLFYSMDSHGDDHAKGEHGGFHEAAIGAGNCAGPAISAAALYMAPQNPNSGALAVGVLLLFGFAGLCWLRWRKVAS